LEFHKFRLFLHILFADPIEEDQDDPFADFDMEKVVGKRLVLVPIKRGDSSIGNLCWYVVLKIDTRYSQFKHRIVQVFAGF
jgi:hypothetical protein